MNSIMPFGVVLLLAVPTGVTAEEYTIPLGAWTRESAPSAFLLAADSSLWNENVKALTVEPEYHADTVFYGFFQAGFRGDTTEDTFYDVVLDRGPGSVDQFYFDANNNQDLTDDGGPRTWVDANDEMEWPHVAFKTVTAYGFPVVVHLLKTSDPRDRMTSAKFGRPVLSYAAYMNSARFGSWVLGGDTIGVQIFSRHPSGRMLMAPGEFLFLDVNDDGTFGFVPPDLYVGLSEPYFELNGKHWTIRVDSTATAAVFREVRPEAVPTPERVEDTAALAKIERRLERLMNEPGPAFSGTDLQGRSLSLAGFEDSVVVLAFWHTGCVPCRKEQPRLNELVAEYIDRPVVFLAPTFNAAVQMPAYLEQFPFAYRILPAAQQMIIDYEVTAYPTHMIIDRHGVVRFVKFGALPDIDLQLRETIDSLLARK
jgi:thiol-disulfide isomerase/thioredoxin